MTSKPMISCSNSPFLIFLTINEVGPILAIRCVRIAFMIRRNGHTERRSDRRTDTPSYEDATAIQLISPERSSRAIHIVPMRVMTMSEDPKWNLRFRERIVIKLALMKDTRDVSMAMPWGRN